MTYKQAQFIVQWMRGNSIAVMGPWWANGRTTGAFHAALKTYQQSIGAPATGQLNTATNGQINYGLKLLAGKNPSKADPGVAKVVADTYGPGLASYLTHWEIGPILVKAAKDGWDQAHLNAAIQKTYWWKNTQQSQREWSKLSVEDPGEMKAQALRQFYKLKAVSKQLGLGLDDGRLFNVAVDSLRFAWDDARTQQILASYFKMGTKGRQRGQIDEKAEQLMATAAEYFVVYSRKSAYEQAKKIVAGTMSETALAGQFAQQAAARFPSLAKAISQGLKPKDYFANHQNAIAQTLERAPEAIDLVNDKRWRPVLESVDKQGRRRPMTVGETEQWARQTTAYYTTRQANESANATVNAIGEAFGKIKL